MQQMSKKARLTQIVSDLGPDAGPAKIREEAYKRGFGTINHFMLMDVRDTLWPNRHRRGGGYSRDQRSQDLVRKLIPCPKCESSRIWAKGKYSHRNGSGLCSRKRLCRDCGHQWSMVEPDMPLSAKQTSLIQWALIKEKECTYCKKVLPIEAFSLQSKSDVIRRPGCKACYAEQRSQSQFRESLKIHGLTPERYQEILDSQGGRCAICRTDKPFGPTDYEGRKRRRRVFSIDHCHETGQVRGLLCARCNIAIGNFGDSVDRLMAAIVYIKAHK